VPYVRGQIVSSRGNLTGNTRDSSADSTLTSSGLGADARPPPIAPRSLIANSTWLLGARIAGLVFGAALSVYAIRQFSVAEWGQYSAVVSLVAIFGVFTEAGISSLTVREITSHPHRETAVLSLAMSAVAVSAAASVILMALISYLLGYAASWPIVVGISACLVATQGLSVPLYAIFNARRVFVFAAIIAGVAAPVGAVVGFPLVAVGVGPAALLVGTLVGQITSVVIGHALVRKKLGLTLRLRRPRASTLRFMAAAVPIGATGGLAIVYQRLDILMLSKLGSSAEVAVYAVPYSLLQYSWMLPSAVTAAFFPLLTDRLRRDPDSARHQFFLLVRLFFLLSVPSAVFLAVGAEPILRAIFGSKYAESGRVLGILAVVGVLTAQNYVLWYGILARGQERLVVAVQAAGLCLNALLNLALIPALGAEGAAAALVASECVVTGGQAWLVHRWVFPIPWGTIFGRLLLGMAIGAGVIAALLPTGRLAAALGGSVACVLVLVLTQYVRRHEWAPLTDPLRRLTAKWRAGWART
jgi:O-antigen/teichoic acid export membrane protein